MTCNRCESNNTSIVDNHYICNDCGNTFEIWYDDRKYFPYNVIFPTRPLIMFYRKPYMEIVEE